MTKRIVACLAVLLCFFALVSCELIEVPGEPSKIDDIGTDFSEKIPPNEKIEGALSLTTVIFLVFVCIAISISVVTLIIRFLLKAAEEEENQKKL